MAYSGASQIIYARQCWHSGSKALSDGIVGRTSNLEMRQSWNSGINNRISKDQLNSWAITGLKKKELVNKIVAKGVAAKPMSNNAPQIKYDVFVSFSGKDIRRSFLGHLTKAFPQKQIYGFVDDKLKRGDDILPSILEAIEGSFMSVIIFSENYASSRWCLEELVKIIECKEKYGQIVIPVFYGVEPTDVRHQKRSYKNAFAAHEKKYNLLRVKGWRDALNKSANLSGSKSLDFPNDAELVEEIINLVLMRFSKHPIKTKGLVGIGKPIAHLKSLLRQDSINARVIGIWGMGGIGKTTIAEEILKQNHSEYEGFCFLAKVSEDLRRHGITSLKEKLFSTLLAENVKIDSPNGLSNYIERRIGRMKVLIVLDDVKEANLLEMLFGTLDWFQSDSRIFVSTRDKQVLIANRVDDIYEVGVLSSTEALELFNLNAFIQSHLEMEYYDISKRLINYAKGIPLVLKVLGRLLRGKDKEVWESQLDKLKKMPIKEVHGVMKLSYDDLDSLEQKIFLDIACFFNGLNLKVDCIKLLLKDYEGDNSVAVGLERLKDQALITIPEDNVISMHEIIQEMGREIIRQESSKDPGSYSRLWDPDDICDVFKNDKGTETVRSLSVDLSAIRKLKLSPRVFAKMSKLKFLDFHGERDQDCLDLLPQGLQSLPTDLRYVRWMHYPLKSLPEMFSVKNLVILDLSYSRLEKLWCGVQNLVNLKEVNFSRSDLLRELPDFSKATNLEVLDLRCCLGLKSIHPSIFSLDKLEKLNLMYCCFLTEFKSDTHLSSLCYLNLGHCLELSKFSVTSENMMELHLEDTCVSTLPSSFGCQSKLEILVLEGINIKSVPSSIKNFTRLRKLDLRLCSELKALPELPSSLETLLAECRSLKTVLFPSTTVAQFKENKKTVKFWNCWNLDERSLRNIGLNMQINLMKFAYQHLSTPEHDYVESYEDYKDNYASYQAVYVYPGSSVPEWLEYKTTKDDMLINLSTSGRLSPLLGFVFCFILAEGTEHCARIELNISVIDREGDDEKEGVNIYMTGSNFPLALDHVCVIYDQPCSHYLTSLSKNQTRFKIKVTARTKSVLYADIDGLEVEVKCFGVSPINTSAYHSFIQQMELFDYINKWNRIVLSIVLFISFLRLKMKNLI